MYVNPIPKITLDNFRCNNCAPETKTENLSQTIPPKLQNTCKKTNPHLKRTLLGIVLGAGAVGAYYATKYIKKHYPIYIAKKTNHLKKNIEFKEAKTLDEAIQFGKKNLKIKKYVNFTEKELDIANWVNKGIVDTSNAMNGRLKNIRNIILTDLNTTTTYAFTKSIVGSHHQPEIYINRNFIKNIDFNITEYEKHLRKNLPIYLLDPESLKYMETGLAKHKRKELVTLLDKISLFNNLAVICDKLSVDYQKIIPEVIKINKNQKKLIEKGLVNPEKPTMIHYLNKDIDLSSKDYSKGLSPKFLKDLHKTILTTIDYEKIKPPKISPYKNIYHEIGHLHHKVLDNKKFASTKLGDYRVNKEWWNYQEKDIKTAEKVSTYASLNPLEFLGETFAYLVSGVKLPPEVIELYKKHDGVIPPNINYQS